ncbi:hypothetical protein R5W24_005237 [Gemmata sp. JC717]|uniref:hypothetical protein n=1 Tax=Gemmata algarum TaxID=2975278 RepID=UPI0021BB5A0F|nr:hypothetical protein [Gemmata algarum]MDY3556074.1 hypothetical protein [Gemmata algarum]
MEQVIKAGTLPVGCEAKDGPAWDKDGQPTSRPRIYLGSDGGMVPTVTDAEKKPRRTRIKAKRQRRSRRSRPLRRSKVGSDGPYKEFKIVTFYDAACDHRLVAATRGDCEQAGRLIRRDAGRVGLDKVDDKVGVVDGSDGIKNPIGRHNLPLDDLGLDFYHLAENVHKAKRAAFGKEDPKDLTAPGNIWASQVLHTTKHEG